MTNVKALLNKTENGFNTLQVSKKYVDSALKWLETWLTDDAFKDYVPQIAYLIKKEKWNFLLDSFYQVIPFGTGGRRGLVGVGPNRINTWTIQTLAQGHSQYLVRQYGEQARQRGVVLAFDVRKYTQKGIYDETLANPVMNLDGRRLAKAAAAVYAANEIKVYMFQNERSTPELSYAIRHLNAVSGVVYRDDPNTDGIININIFDNQPLEVSSQFAPECQTASHEIALLEQIDVRVKRFLKDISIKQIQIKVEGQDIKIEFDLNRNFQINLIKKILAMVWKNV
jgi:phosphoglucomutase/phosphomannomutase